MKDVFDLISRKSSRITTLSYSTSFSLGIGLFDKKYRDPVYAIYGFVRLADEIVDTFHNYDKNKLFSRFSEDTWDAIKEGISMNPILNSFQNTVNKYSIDHDLIIRFLESMEMDLDKKEHTDISYKNYILGSAEVVGLMCLRVFCDGNQERYDALKPSAMSLGSAFQKINFLRDMKNDYQQLGRTYFPSLDYSKFNEESKKLIELDIEKDFREGHEGIKKLPKGARLGVYVAYIYYYSLFKKIRKLKPAVIKNRRVRISNPAKYRLLVFSYFRHSLNLL
jgi:phytoene/squalene synthetase